MVGTKSFYAIEERLCVLYKHDPALNWIQKNSLPFPSKGYIFPDDRDYIMSERYQLHIFESWQARDRWIEKRNNTAWQVCDHHKYLSCKAYPIEATRKTKDHYIRAMQYNHTFFRLWDDAKNIAEYNLMLNELYEPMEHYGNEYAIRYLEREYERKKLLKA